MKRLSTWIFTAALCAVLALGQPFAFAANGDIQKRFDNGQQIVLLDAQTAGSTGQWVDIGPYDSIGIYIDHGNAADTIDVQGMVAATMPANATAGAPLITQVTAAGKTYVGLGGIGLPNAPRFIKAVKGGATGTSTVAIIVRKGY